MQLAIQAVRLQRISALSLVRERNPLPGFYFCLLVRHMGVCGKMKLVCANYSGHEATRIGETRPSLLGAEMLRILGWDRNPENYQLANQWPVVCCPLTY